MALIRQTKQGAWAAVTVSGSSVTLDSAPVEGNTIVGLLYTEDCPTVTTLAGSGWTLRATGTSNHGVIYIFTKPVLAGTSATIASTTGGAGRVAVHAVEVQASYDAAGAISAGASNLTTFTGASVAAVATGDVGVVLTAFIPSYQTYNIGSLTATGSLTELYETSDGIGRCKAFLGYQEVASLTGSYQHAVTSTVRPSDNDASNNWASATIILKVVDLTAEFSGTPTTGDKPLSVDFTDESYGGSGVSAWEWDFGDGTTSTEQNPTHVYAEAGTYTVTLVVHDPDDAADSETKVAYITVTLAATSDPTETPDAWFWIDWDNDGFVSGGTSDHELARMLPEGSVADDNMTPYAKSIRWQRGGQQDLIGGQQVGSLTAILHNIDGRFTPDNAAGPLYGKLDVGRKVWLGGQRSTGTYKGLWAGYIKEIVPLPRTKEVQIICHDAFGVWQESRVRASFSRTRSAAGWRDVVLDALGLPDAQRTLASEAYPLAFSGADTKNGLALLDELNQQTGVRHLILPADDKDVHFYYKTIGRNQNLGIDAPVGSLTEDDITGMQGYRRTHQTVINYQQVTSHHFEFAAEQTKVWEYADIPFSVPLTGTRIIKANLNGWVNNPRVVITSSVLGETSVYAYAPTGPLALTHYGQSAEIAMNGVGVVTRLQIWGQASSEPGQSVEFSEDISSQGRYGIREGTPVDATLLSSSAQAEAIAQTVVYRSKTPRTRPSVSFRNRFDKTLTFDHGDVVAQSLDELAIVSRRYEIVGVSGAITEGGLWWDFGWTYLETPYQTTLALFTLDESALNSADILGF